MVRTHTPGMVMYKQKGLSKLQWFPLRRKKSKHEVDTCTRKRSPYNI